MVRAHTTRDYGHGSQTSSDFGLIRAMDRMPRLLVLIGSGELAAQMTRGHRMIVRRLLGNHGHARPSDIRLAIIDTPYGFQENADALSATLLDYFGRRIGTSADICSLRRADDDILSRETAFALIREADFVFSGPGSPSYALRQWAGSPISQLLADKLVHGGALVFASAAALTLGRLTVPVYEIYKAGDDPYWLPGLDVLGAVGINAAVIPHFDNAEGGTHDTRYCYLGERRLTALEEQMPTDTFILGVDEHTALMLDFDAGTAAVHGRGGVTIRTRGESRVIPTGETFDLKELQTVTTTGPVERKRTRAADATASTDKRGDASSVARRLVALEKEQAQTRERERLVEPLIQSLLEIRQLARERGDFGMADDIRKRLVALGVQISDSPSGTAFRVKRGNVSR